MGTIREYLNNAKEARANLLDESERIVYAHENAIIRLNTSQFESGEGSDGDILVNANPIFSGRYTLFTQMLNLNKRAGELYDFNNTGSFLSGLQIEMSNDKMSFYVFSTGTGSGDKKAFFDGYNNLFGLDKKNSNLVNYEILLPEILNYLNSRI